MWRIFASNSWEQNRPSRPVSQTANPLPAQWANATLLAAPKMFLFLKSTAGNREALFIAILQQQEWFPWELALGGGTVVWWKMWNFIVRQVNFNSFLHPNEPPQRIFWYLVRKLKAEQSKIGHNLTEYIWLNMNKIENDFDKTCSPNLIFQNKNRFLLD